MIDPARDIEGLELAIGEIFIEDFVRARIDRESAGASEYTRKSMERQIPMRTLSPGYYRWAEHLFNLDAQRRAGIALQAAELAAAELAGLVALDRARGRFEHEHPACSACGARQENRFSQECRNCGASFRRRKK